MIYLRILKLVSESWFVTSHVLQRIYSTKKVIAYLLYKWFQFPATSFRGKVHRRKWEVCLQGLLHRHVWRNIQTCQVWIQTLRDTRKFVWSAKRKRTMGWSRTRVNWQGIPMLSIDQILSKFCMDFPRSPVMENVTHFHTSSYTMRLHDRIGRYFMIYFWRRDHFIGPILFQNQREGPFLHFGKMVIIALFLEPPSLCNAKFALRISPWFGHCLYSWLHLDVSIH